MIKHIQFTPLCIGMIIGVIAIMFVKPEKTVVYKYPNPEVSQKIIYKDKNGVCYAYAPKKVFHFYTSYASDDLTLVTLGQCHALNTNT